MGSIFTDSTRVRIRVSIFVTIVNKNAKVYKTQKVMVWHHYQRSERLHAPPGRLGRTASRLQPRISGLTCDNMIFYSTNTPLSPLYGLQILITFKIKYDVYYISINYKGFVRSLNDYKNTYSQPSNDSNTSFII